MESGSRTTKSATRLSVASPLLSVTRDNKIRGFVRFASMQATLERLKVILTLESRRLDLECLIVCRPLPALSRRIRDPLHLIMAHCSPFEDYEYIIFGHDRWFIVAADFLCLLFWIPTFFRLDSSCLKLYLTAATVPMFPLIPVRVAKTLHTVLAPANVEDSWIYCWYLRVEYTLHYWLSYAFLTSTCVYLFLVLKRRSTIFPMERVHMKIFAGMLVEALFRAIVTEFLDQLLWFWPSVVHIWLQILLTMSWFLFMFLHPCRALNHPKEGHGGWSLAWLHLYLVIPFLLNLYQSLFQAAILFPRHSVAGYEAVAADQATYWFSVESYISHKFSFTTMGIIGPMVLLPPVRRAYWKGTVQRRDVIAPAKEAVYGGEGDGPE